MRYLPLLLLLSACATSPGARTTYSQSAPVPEFESAWTAPHTTGQPGYVSPEDVPRSPHKRVLPQTPETMRGPGIWAGDHNDGWSPPLRHRGEPIPHMEIAEVEIPVVEEARDAVDTISTEQCAYITRTGIVGARIGEPALRGLSQKERECLIASAMSACQTWLAATWLVILETAKTSGAPLDEDPTDRFHYGALAISKMTKWRTTACSNGGDTSIVHKYLDEIAAYNARTRGPAPGQVH